MFQTNGRHSNSGEDTSKTVIDTAGGCIQESRPLIVGACRLSSPSQVDILHMHGNNPRSMQSPQTSIPYHHERVHVGSWQTLHPKPLNPYIPRSRRGASLFGLPLCAKAIHDAIHLSPHPKRPWFRVYTKWLQGFP